MRVTRTKRCKRVMNFYVKTFGFRHPFQVIVDPEFIQAAIISKLRLQRVIEEVLTGPVKIMITRCAINELKRLGDRYFGALVASRSFELVRNCNHEPGSISTRECIRKQIGPSNKCKYVIGTQDMEFRTELSELGGIPTIHIFRGVLQLDQISTKSRDINMDRESKKGKITKAEKKEIAKLVTQITGESQKPPPIKKHRRKVAKGPNPLSVKKKKRPISN